VALTGRGGPDRMAIAVATDRGPWRGAGSIPNGDIDRSRRPGAEGDMTTSINGLWKLPELWKPAGTAGPGSHKFFAKRPTVERFAQAPTGHHQRLLGLSDSEDTHPLAKSGATMRQSERTQTHSGTRDPLSGRRSRSARASLIRTDGNLGRRHRRQSRPDAAGVRVPRTAGGRGARVVGARRQKSGRRHGAASGLSTTSIFQEGTP
jgi:hypothetical protein